MYPRIRALLAVGTLAVAACSDDRGIAPEITGPRADLVAGTGSAALTATNSLTVGQRITLKASNSRSRLKWTSSDSRVVSVSSSGTATANAVGTATVRATGTGVYDTWYLTVNPVAVATVTSFSTAPANVTLLPGASQQFSSTATWSDGGFYPFSVTYSAQGGTISSTGLFTAGSTAGRFMVIAACLCGLSDTSFVTVPSLTLTIAPKSVSLTAGQAQQFSASALWSSGATALPPLTWTTTGGAITSNGAYTAPATAGTYKVYVSHTGGTAKDSAVVTVGSGTTTTPPPPTAPTAPTTGWSIDRDFNSGVVGTSVNRAASGFDDVAGGTLFSSEKWFEGGMSGRVQIDSASDGWGQWGGVMNFPTRLVAGDELWLEVYVYLPSDFQIKTTPGWLKFLRVRTKTETGGNSGYNDLYLCDDGRDCQFGFIKEIQDAWFTFGAPRSFTRDRWHRFDVHYRFDNVARAQGGRSQVRIWQNGVLMLDERRVQTLTNATDFTDSFYMFTYWNGGAPRSQTAWVDKIRLSNTKPSWVSDLQSVDNY